MKYGTFLKLFEADKTKTLIQAFYSTKLKFSEELVDFLLSPMKNLKYETQTESSSGESESGELSTLPVDQSTSLEVEVVNDTQLETQELPEVVNNIQNEIQELSEIVNDTELEIQELSEVVNDTKLETSFSIDSFSIDFYAFEDVFTGTFTLKKDKNNYYNPLQYTSS